MDHITEKGAGTPMGEGSQKGAGTPMGEGSQKTSMRPCSTVMELPSLAMAYVPFQRWEEIYEPEKGFEVGTIFPCLNLPFTGGKR